MSNAEQIDRLERRVAELEDKMQKRDEVFRAMDQTIREMARRLPISVPPMGVGY